MSASGPAARSRALSVSYLLPLKRSGIEPVDELAGYLAGLCSVAAEVIVVDGSPPEVFAHHGRALGDAVRHVPVSGWCPNGKVAGVLTGLALCRQPGVVIADDDVRYDKASLTAVLAALDDVDVVVPQNYFSPLPWHARWDTARTLLNRAVASDYPGTLAVRREVLARSRGYCGAVLFENLELLRTVHAAGGWVSERPDLFVARLPPSAAGFGSQRVRQAYDSLAQPARLLLELALLPAVVTGVLGRRWRGLFAGGVAVMLLAERGRRRDAGRRVFPATSALWAPAWLTERAVCSWLALGSRLRGGAPYAGSRLRTAAHPASQLRAASRGERALPCPERVCVCTARRGGQPVDGGAR
ncbi:MAG: hypothetical protein ACR2KL_13785 [Nocardioidaceae bacterium]